MVDLRRLSQAAFRRARLRRNLGLRRRHPYDWPRLHHASDTVAQYRWLTESRERWRQWTAGAPDDGEMITVICATCRPANLGRILENFDRQRYREKRLVVIPNNADFDAAALRRLRQRGVIVPTPGDGDTLGDHLNLGLEVAGVGLAAKFDDDDDYGPGYLSHLRHGLRRSGATVAGKHTTFGYLAADDTMIVRFPGHEMEYTLTVAGGTLLIDLDSCGDIRFPSLGVGEDIGLIRAVEHAGGLVFSTDRFNYVQRRTGENTWTLPDTQYQADAIAVSHGRRLDVAFGTGSAIPHTERRLSQLASLGAEVADMSRASSGSGTNDDSEVAYAGPEPSTSPADREGAESRRPRPGADS